MSSVNEPAANPSPSPGFAAIGKAVDSMSSSFGFVGGVLLMLAGFIITFEVFMRYVLNSPTAWTYETSSFLVMIGTFATIAYGLKRDSHVNVEFIINRLSVPIRKMLEIVSYLTILGFSVFYINIAAGLAVASYNLDEISALMCFPLWPLKALILLTIIMLAFQSVRMLVADIMYLLSHPEEVKPGLKRSVLAVLFFLAAIAVSLFLFAYVNITVGMVLLMIVLMAGGVPIGFSIAVATILGFVGMLGVERGLAAIPQAFYMTWSDFNVISLPLFIFLGYVMFKTGLADDLFRFARVWVGHLPGGLAVATLIVCGIFAAVSGSSMANAVTVGLIAIPAMIKYNYNQNMAAGLVAVGGTLGVLIPPSSAFLMIGIMTNESIGKLFMAGMVPGILAIVLLSTAAVIVCMKTGAYKPLPDVGFKEKMIGTKNAIGSLLMPVIMLGGIYTGVFTPTEAAGVALVYSVLYALLSGRIKLNKLSGIITESTETVAMVGVLVAGGMAMGTVSTMLQVPQKSAEWVVSSGWPGWAIILGTLFVLFILDIFMDAGSITILTIPIFMPMIKALGYDPMWYAVIFVIFTEIGLITPPVGMNAFVVSQVSGIELMNVVRGSIVFLLIMLLLLIMVWICPPLATWLPSTMQ